MDRLKITASLEQPGHETRTKVKSRLQFPNDTPLFGSDLLLPLATDYVPRNGCLPLCCHKISRVMMTSFTFWLEGLYPTEEELHTRKDFHQRLF
mmetsp:Transcript_19525/g.45433  ORF Transcript_19525/g.45433 Transcript_19525/m.45433 type:complete len:94 (+) Transcript_19525:662-943(+)